MGVRAYLLTLQTLWLLHVLSSPYHAFCNKGPFIKDVPYRRIEEKTGRFGPASMEVAILSIFTGSDEEPAAIERYN